MSRPWLFALFAAASTGCLEDEVSSTRDVGAAVTHPDASVTDAPLVIFPDASAVADATSSAPDAMISAVCELGVRPSALELGAVEVGRQSRLPIELVNAGGAPCAIESVQVTGDSEIGLLSGFPSTVPADGSVALWVRFDARAAGAKTARIEVVSGRTTRQVDVAGTGRFSGLRAVPSAIDMGATRRGCRQTTLLGFSGEVPAGVTVESLELDAESSSAFTLEQRPVPFTIAERGLVGIFITHRAAKITDDSARVQLRLTGVAEPYVLGVVAHGLPINQKFTERFPPVSGPLDLLFVVDDSVSMTGRAGAVASAASKLVGQLVTAGADLHVGVTTANSALGRGGLVELDMARWLDRTTPDLPAAAARLAALVPPARNDGKTGTEAAYLALTGPAIGGVNRGFLRPDASLAIVVISDSDDGSARLTDFYSSSFRDIQAIRHDRTVTFHALVMLPSDPQSCFMGTSSVPGPKYVDMASRTGGRSASLCAADWDASLPPLVEVMTGRRDIFPIDPPGDPFSLEVDVDGVRVMTGWRYDMMARAVRFEEAARPAKSATVDIRYGPECF